MLAVQIFGFYFQYQFMLKVTFHLGNYYSIVPELHLIETPNLLISGRFVLLNQHARSGNLKPLVNNFFGQMLIYVFLSFRALRKLEALVILNESLKQQDFEFREQCKLELGNLQKLVK
jgi:hypothetical protein